MSLTIRERILANRLAALVALNTPTILFPVIARAQGNMFQSSQFPAIFIYPGKETKKREGEIYQCELAVTVEISEQLDNTTPDTFLNAHLLLVQNAMSLDTTCGGIARSCFELENDFAVGMSAASGLPDRAVIMATWQIKYSHKAKDPTLNN